MTNSNLDLIEFIQNPHVIKTLRQFTYQDYDGYMKYTVNALFHEYMIQYEIISIHTAYRNHIYFIFKNNTYLTYEF